VTRHQPLPGTDLGFPVPIAEEVWRANVAPQLRLEGELMTLWAHEPNSPHKFDTVHHVGFDLGTYVGTATRNPLIRDLDDSGAMTMVYERIFANPKDLPA
jgi:hypothetical protein